MKFIILFLVLFPSILLGDSYQIKANTGQDNCEFIKAFNAAIISHDVINIEAGTYTLAIAMPPITNSLTVKSDGRAVLNYTGVGPLFTISARNVEIRGLVIKGNELSDGILAHDNSWLSLKNLTLSNLNVALEYDYFHDSNADNVKFYNNNIDMLADKRQITSIKFNACHFERSNYAVKINTTSTNLVFSNGGFAPTGTNNPVQITNATFNGVFENNRFENKGLANALYINGQSHDFPAQTIIIQNNYFTGKIVSGIHLGRLTNNVSITGNHFNVDPTVADIFDEGIKSVVIENNHPSAHLNRTLIVIKESNTRKKKR